MLYHPDERFRVEHFHYLKAGMIIAQSLQEGEDYHLRENLHRTYMISHRH